MAAFPEGADALEAAARCQRGWAGFLERAGHPPGETLLRVGVHAGPCYAVTSNRALDYFGQTVNVAARMEGLADGGEIVASEASLGPGALPAGLRLVERVRVTPRGLPGPVSVARLRLNEEALRRAA